MKRLLESQLATWLSRKGRKPLIIRGARQVGKSTLVRQFAKNQALELTEINLEKHSHLNTIFKTKDLSRIIPEIEGLANKLVSSNTLLFLDEIQATPEAIPALRYFYEEKPDLPVIAAGSLLEFVLADHTFSMPVGRIEYMHLGPMSFTEFLMALEENFLVNLLSEKRVTSESAHRNLLQLQRQYLFVGGMPESVLRFSETRSPLSTSDVHHSIVQTYEDDFSKYARKDQDRELLSILMKQIPTLLGKKVVYSRVSSQHRSAVVKKAIDLMIKSRLLIPAYHSDCSGIPIRAGEDRNVYKLYFLDVGLMNHLCGLAWTQISNLDERQLIHEGIIAEQFVAQHLAYLPHPYLLGGEVPALNYWLRQSRSQNAEVDFVMQMGALILPIEVKSGKSGSLKSLQQFMISKGLKLALRFDLNPPTVQEISHKNTSGHPGEFTLHSWPLYEVEKIRSVSYGDKL